MQFYRQQFPGDRVFTNPSKPAPIGSNPVDSLKKYLSDIKQIADNRKPILKSIQWSNKEASQKSKYKPQSGKQSGVKSLSSGDVCFTCQMRPLMTIVNRPAQE